MAKEAYSSPYVVSGTNYPHDWGHAVTRMKGTIINNYSREGKENRFKFSHLQELIKSNTVFKNGYIFLKK